MGVCYSLCFSKDRKISYAYRTELGSGLVKELLPKLPIQHSKVIVIRLKSIQDIEPTTKASKINPYVEMKLRSPDPIAGEQYQRSSYKPETFTPKWEPDEKFQFILTDTKPVDIIISVYSFNHGRHVEPTPLGDSILKTMDVKSKDAVMKSLKVVNPNTGRPNGLVNVQIQLRTINQALSCEEHTIYQYERWQPGLSPMWGNTYPGYLLPTDPGRWSTVDGQTFGKEIEDVSPPLPSGWKVEREWYTLANDDDPEGWQYAMDFTSFNWYSKVGSGLVVRRRAWRREITAIEKAEAVANAIRRGRKISDGD